MLIESLTEVYFSQQASGRSIRTTVLFFIYPCFLKQLDSEKYQ